MYNQTFIIPRYYNLPNLMHNAMLPATSPTKNILFNRLGNLFQGIKKFNWTNLINNTSKTLGIINQSIPLVKQTGPIINNMRSMIKLASVFKDETDIKPHKTQHQNTDYPHHQSQTESPTFFIK